MKLIPRYQNEVPRYDGGGWLEMVLPSYLIHRFSSKKVSSDPHDKYKGDNPSTDFVDGVTGASVNTPVYDTEQHEKWYNAAKQKHLSEGKQIQLPDLEKAIKELDEALKGKSTSEIMASQELSEILGKKAAYQELLDSGKKAQNTAPKEEGQIIDQDKYNKEHGWLSRQWDSYVGTAYNDSRGWLHPKYYLPALGALSIAPLSSTAAESALLSSSTNGGMAYSLFNTVPGMTAVNTFMSAHPILTTTAAATLVSAAGPGQNMVNNVRQAQNTQEVPENPYNKPVGAAQEYSVDLKSGSDESYSASDSGYTPQESETPQVQQGIIQRPAQLIPRQSGDQLDSLFNGRKQKFNTDVDTSSDLAQFGLLDPRTLLGKYNSLPFISYKK